MKSRLYYAVACFILAVILLFITVPILYPKIQTVRVMRSFHQGEQLTEKDLEIVEAGALDLPDGIELIKDDVIGRYAAVDLVKDDVLFSAKISQLPLDGDHPKDILPEGNKAQLVMLKMIEGSEYPIPQTGDVVKLNLFKERLLDIPELQFIRILSVVPAETEEEMVSVTISLNEEQQKYIRRHKDEVFYASVIVRSNEELAEKLLTEQKAYFEEDD